MVAIVSGMRPGLNLGSREVLGQAGVVGNAAEGRNGQGVYVNAATGNLVVQAQDEILVGRGTDVASLRTYNSAGVLSDDNGDNWGSGVVSLRLTGTLNAAGSTMKRIDADGSTANYDFDATRLLYVTSDGAGANDTITWLASLGQFEWREGSSGTAERYEGSGAMRMVSRRDTSDNTVVFNYGTGGFLASVFTANGEATYYDYSGANLVQVRTVAADGTTTTRVRYNYDASNRLSLVTVDLSPADNTIADSRVYLTTYTYEGASKRIASISQTDGERLSFAYVDTGGGNYKVSSVTNALGQATSFAYGSGYTTVTDAKGLVTRFDYDGSGQLTKITPPAVAGVAASRSFAYDVNGNVTSVTDGEGRAVTYGYDWRANQVLQRDALGNTVKRTFDARNQLLTESVYVQPDPDGAGPAVPDVPLTTRYVYDAGGRNLLRFVVSAEGGVTEHRYDGFGQRVASITYTAGVYPVSGLAADAAPTEAQLTTWTGTQDRTATQRVDFAYDARGQVNARTTYAKVDANGTGVADGTRSVETFVYDRAGQLLQTVAGRGGVTQFTYDGLGRRLTETDALGQVTVTQYGDAGNMTTVRLASGLVTTSAYDLGGRLATVTQSGTAGVVLGTSRYSYDNANRLRMVEDPTGVRNWLLYDEAGRKTAEVDGTGRMTEYSYNRADQVVRIATWGSPVSQAGRDYMSALPSTTATAANVRPAASDSDVSLWREYDATGRLLREAQQVGDGSRAAVTETRYDGASRIVQVVRFANTVPADGSAGSAGPGVVPAPAASDKDRSSRNFYDQDGRLAGTLDAQGYLTVFGYTAGGQLAEKKAYATPTDPGKRAGGSLAQLTPAIDPHDIREVTLYDGKGLVAAQVDGEGYLTEFVRDANGNVTLSTRYANRVTATVGVASTLAAIRPAPSAKDRTTGRSYDALDRLWQENSPEGVATQYGYDSNGKLVSTTRALGTEEYRNLFARYDVQGRLTAELSAEGALLLTGGQTQAQVDAIWAAYGESHTYDAAGRRTSSKNALGHQTWYYYDAAGHLTHTVNALGQVQETRYDTRGRITARVNYAARIATTGLTGGLVSAPLLAAVAAIVNPAADSVTSIGYTREGHVSSETDAVGTVTTHGYNAFGDEVGSSIAGTSVSAAQTYVVDGRGLRTGSLDALGGSTSAVYDAFGRLTQSTDANGKVRVQDYDRLGRVVTVRDAMNATRSTDYDAIGRVLTQTDALGYATRYAYDAPSRKVTVTTAEGVVTSTVYTRHGQVQSVTDGKGQVTSYIYDRNGNLKQTSTPLTTTTNRYDAANRQLEATDANGNKVSYTYDAANRMLTRCVDPAGLALTTSWLYDPTLPRVSTTDPLGTVTMTEYDRKGRVVKQTVDPGGLNLQTTWSYDGRDNTLTVTSPAGTLTQYVYDALGRRTLERVDPNGLDLRRSWSYDAKGNVLRSTDALGNPTRYAYDANDRLVFTLAPLGNLKRVDYDTAGRVVKSTTYAQQIATGALGATPSVATIAAAVVTSPQDVVENRVYDRDGRLAASVDGTGGVVKYTYDANGNVVSRMAFAKPIVLSSWTPGTMPAALPDGVSDQTVQTLYDALNRAVYTMDALGGVVAQAYDGNGNVLQRTAYAAGISGANFKPSSIAAALAAVANPAHDQTVRNTYDAAGRLIFSVDGMGAVTQRVYDNNGNVVQQVAYATAIAAGANPTSVIGSSMDRAASMAYDTANRLVMTVDALGAVVEQVFDANGNVVRRTAYAKTVGGVPPLGSRYTAGLIRQSLVPDASIDRSAWYGYDAAGRQVLAVDAMGSVVGTQYDGAGQAVSVIRYGTTIATDGLGPAPSLSTIQALVRTSTNLDRTTKSVYDAAGRLAFSLSSVGFASDARLAVQSAVYDGAGRMLVNTRYANTIAASTPATVDSVSAALVPDGEKDQAEQYSYDAAGHRLSHTNALGARESYSYDALGNKLTFTNRSGSTWTYTYDAAGRQATETSPTVDHWRYALDSVGNLAGAVQEPNGIPIVTRMTYDALGNLTQRTEAVGLTEERTTGYEYDAVGRQVAVIYPTIDIYDPATNGTTAARLETRTFYDAQGNAVAGRDIGYAVSQKTYDRMGRVVYEIDPLGYVTEYGRNAFGEVTRLTRHATQTTLAQPALAQASEARSTAFVESVINAAGFDCSNDRTVTTVYDRAGRVIETDQPTSYVYDSSDLTGHQVGYWAARTVNSYDAFGQLLQSSTLRNAYTGAAATTTHYYDVAGRETVTVDALGYATTRAFDTVGNLTYQREYATAASNWTIWGVALPTASADDRATSYTYDRLNRKTGETRHAVEFSTNSNGTSMRGDVVTSYGYDALGNQTSVTDANGGVTSTKYDALGRIVATLAPSRLVRGTPTIPLTVFHRDAYGDVIQTIEYAKGAVASNSLDPVGNDGADRVTLAQFDRFGHSVQTQNADGVRAYASYDPYGHVAMKWQYVTGSGETYEINKYDAVGQLISTRTPASTSVVQNGTIVQVSQAQTGQVTTDYRYNGFGELTGKGINVLNDQYQEYFDYDRAGRLWRTNTGDGVDRIKLYDLQGNQTADISSAGAAWSNLDLKTITSPAAADGANGVRRTDMVYDQLGRLTQKMAPSREDKQDGVLLVKQTPQGRVNSSASYLSTESYGGPTGSNNVSLTWTDLNPLATLSTLGSGDIKVYIEYHQREWNLSTGTYTASPIVRAYSSGIFNGDRCATGVDLDWQEQHPVVMRNDVEGTLYATLGISDITRIVVYKKNSAAYWQPVIDQAPNSTTYELRIDTPDNPNVGITMQTLKAGDTVWKDASLTAFGDQYRYDARSLSAGSYQYRVTEWTLNEVPHVVASGTLSVGSLGDSQSIAWNGEDRWLRPTVFQQTDRWGNVVDSSDPRGPSWHTKNRYNANNQMVQQTLPDLAALTSSSSPVSWWYYDKLGRQVATRDAVQNVNGQVYDAGGNLVQELHADGGVVTHTFDVFGQKVATQQADNGGSLSFTYDKSGHMLSMTKGWAAVYRVNGGNLLTGGTGAWLTDTWTYDELGRKLTQTNGDGQTITYVYDTRGNLVSTQQPLGQKVLDAYDAQGNKIAEVDGNAKIATWEYDYFGALQKHWNIAGVQFKNEYDNARQLTLESSGQLKAVRYTYDRAGQVITISDEVDKKITSYMYDLSGRHVRERVKQDGITYQDNRLGYDTQGHLRDASDGRVHVSMDYDAVGNRVHIGTYVDYQGVGGETSSSTDKYYRYDAMNRQVVVDGIDSNGNIGQQGHLLKYDKNGNRISDEYYGGKVVLVSGAQKIISGYKTDGTAIYTTATPSYYVDGGYTTETYRYDSLNRLQSVVRDGTQVDVRLYDGADRVVYSGPVGMPSTYRQYFTDSVLGQQALGSEIRISRYDANGQLQHQSLKKNDGSTIKAEISWQREESYAANGTSYHPAGYDNAGNALGYVVWTPENGVVNSFTTRYTPTGSEYSPADGYVAYATSGTSSALQPGTTTETYDVNGFLVGVTDSGRAQNNRTFVNDAYGHMLYVKQDGLEQRQFVVNGEILGRYGVRPDPNTPANPWFGAPTGTNSVDLDFGYARVSSTYPGASPGSYQVRVGDSLQSIAQSAYGDSSLWYRIADANGVASNSDLHVGQTLTIPNRVSTINNNAGTFKPYDPSAMQGDMTPTLAAPPKKKGSVWKMLIMIVVAVVATILTAGAAAMALGTASTATGLATGVAGAFSTGLSVLSGGVVGGVSITAGALSSTTAIAAISGAVGGAIGSIASQGVAIATGLQNGFNWKSVGLSALAGGFSAGVGAPGEFLHGEGIGAAVGRAVVSNVATQGVGAALGLQKRFDWRGVAGAAVGSAVGYAVGSALGGERLADDSGWARAPAFESLGKAGKLISATISGMAGATASALARGGAVVVQQIAVDAFGNALGQSLADSQNSPGGSYQGDGVAGRPYVGFNGDHIVFAGSTASPLVSEEAQAVVSAVNGFSAQGMDGEPGVVVADASDSVQFGRGRNSIYDVDRKTYLIQEGTSPAVVRELELKRNIDQLRAIEAQAKGLNTSRGAGEISASVLYQQGLGDIRDTSPPISVLRSHEGGLVDVPSTTFSHLEPASEALQTLGVAAESAVRSVMEVPLMAVDLVQAAGGAAYSVGTGRVPDITMYSGIGRGAQEGATVGESLQALNPVYGLLVAQHDIRRGLDEGDTRPLAAFAGTLFGSTALGAGIPRLPAGAPRFVAPPAQFTAFGSLQPPVRPMRPSWRVSELDLETLYGQSGYTAQASFLKGTPVSRGTAGSTRPDLHAPGESIDIKNYNLSTPQGQRNLVRDVAAQAQHRAQNLPAGDVQKLVIDARGQNVSTVTLNRLAAQIQQRSNGVISTQDVTFWR